MNLTLAHPADEELGQFVEGTLDEPQRQAVVAHIADCDECRITVVDSSELAETALKPAGYRQWAAIAASLILVVAMGTFIYTQTRDPLAPAKEAYSQLRSRPIEGRLSEFSYVRRITMRGGNDEIDPTLLHLQSEAADAAELRGQTPKKLHARGVGLLLEGTADESLAPLTTAAKNEPDNMQYQADLAASLIAAGSRDQRKLNQAVEVCDRALLTHPRAPEVLFNRAVALQSLDRTRDAIAAYNRYLAVDPSSEWAAEARKNREMLSSSLTP